MGGGGGGGAGAGSGRQIYVSNVSILPDHDFAYPLC